VSTPLRERPDAPLGTLIFRAGLLPAETIESALEEGVKTGKRLGEILTERGLISEVDLARLLAGQKGLEFVTLREQIVDPSAATLFTEEQARLFRALPYSFDGELPVVAIADPTDEVLMRNIREALGREDARFVVSARGELADIAAGVYARAMASGPSPEPAGDPAPELPAAPGPDLAAHTEHLNGNSPDATELILPAPAPDPVVDAAPEPAPDAPEAPEPPAFQVPVAEEPVAEEPVALEPIAEPPAEPGATVEPIPAPAPARTPEPVASPDPQPFAEPAVSEPVPTPEPNSAFEPVEPEPVVASEPQLRAEPVRWPAPLPPPPAPVSEPVASTEPIPLPQPEPAPPAPPYPPAATVPEPPFEAPPVPAPEEPTAAETPEPVAAGAPDWRLTIRLTTGERVEAGDYADQETAKQEAKALMMQVADADSGEWPFVNGRFLKPDTIVSVDIAELSGDEPS
jgi:Type II secretion system (T2SS), protein E, N-terminal domain